MIASEYLVTSASALDALYDAPPWAAIAKETETLIPPYQAFVEASPYVTLATTGPNGVECSPRGDAPGFVRVCDEKTLIIPSRDGNNRNESLHNIVRDPRVALHFLIPGCGETLRVKGRAVISTDPTLTGSFAADGKSPRTVIVVSIESVYFHCAKAIRRSKLWDVTQHIARERLPSVNAILASVQWRRCRDALQGGFRRRSAKTQPPVVAEPPVAAQEPQSL
ncbi:MAG TPA: MSMEG_1061 family FMN-dependent PPOX-type flavoprotein [Pseudolabrys sp.]|nr:MSMEG_1061 family FMN-dependent PPOX-type flavoprotein [Pseudolabrys sp.]